METAKLYVGNLPFSTTEDELRDLFSSVGEVSEIRLITDRDTGRSKGFGFITMSKESEADKALEELNGKELGGRSLRIDKARPSTGGGRGGRNGGGGRSGGGFREHRQY